MYFLRTAVSNFDAAQRQTRKVFENMDGYTTSLKPCVLSKNIITNLNNRYWYYKNKVDVQIGK